MAEQGNILSFDTMRRSSGKARRSLYEPKKDKALIRSTSKPSEETRKRGGSHAKRPTVTEASTSSRRPTTNLHEARQSERARTRKTESTPKKDSWWTSIKRERTKSRAGKAYSRQFRETAPSASSSGPRAALYKGEMGKQHKKMTNMQKAGSAKKAKTGMGFISSRFDWFKSPKRSAGILVSLGLVLACAFLYPTAQQYYTTVRHNEALQAEYAALVERNENIQSEVDQLSTEEGIEDRARQEFGWVKEGDNSVTVFGLGTDNDAPSYMQNIPAGGVNAPDTWYSPLLDLIFRVS